MEVAQSDGGGKRPQIPIVPSLGSVWNSRTPFLLWWKT